MDNLREMTIEDLLKNPTGKGSAVGASRKFIIQDLDTRYLKILLDHNNKMEVRAFKSKNDYLVKVKVPAEKYKELYYDVLIMFTPECDTKEETESVKNDTTLNRYKLKLFSNSPNFMFTYTYVLNKNGMLIPNVKHKCSSKALTDPPTIKNPVESYGFEKSCYFACKYLKQIGYLNKLVIEQNLFIYDEIKIHASVKHQEVKLKEYKLAQQKNKSTVKEAKREKKNTTLKSVKKPKK